jgi:tRNA threonylcarbamoyladenosine biosynthesis protein TsaB
MIVLALDSTTRAGSVALWRDGRVDVHPGEASRTHAERLPAELADLLAAHRLSVADVDLFAVASGPGSFTGMRVGIATMQALALVQGKSIVALSTLELLARAGLASADATPAIVVAWMEAYRGEVFAAVHRVEGDLDAACTIEVLEPAAVGRPADLAEALGPRVLQASTGRNPHSPILVVGDATPSTHDILGRAFGERATLLDAPPLAGLLARAAAAAPTQAVRPHAVVPVYVRRPDAELGRERQQLAATQRQPDPARIAPVR